MYLNLSCPLVPTLFPAPLNIKRKNGTSTDVKSTIPNLTAGDTTSNDATATNLMNVINTSSGPAGTRFTATVDGAVVTITQATIGIAGNTTVTLTDSGTVGMTKTNFTGGGDDGGDVSLKIQAGDGAGNWCDLQTLITDTHPTITGITYTTLDLRNVYIPVFRFAWNTENEIIKTVSIGTLNFRLATPS